jgi:TPR repeat protein
MTIRAGGALAITACAVLLVSSPAHAGAACTSESQCKTSCDGGDLPSCRELGRMYATGDGVEPDHAAAAEAWGKACTLGGTGKVDARSCLELSKLRRSGWVFEVPRDLYASEDELGAALDTATPACDSDGGQACYTVALAERERLERDGWPKDQKDRGADVVARAKKACDGGVVDACVFIRRDLWPVLNAELVTADAFNDAGELAEKKLLSLCTDGNAEACFQGAGYINDQKQAKTITAAVDKGCDAGKPKACLGKAMVLLAQLTSFDKDNADLQLAIKLFIDACAKTKGEFCTNFGEGMIHDSELEELGAHDPEKGLAILRVQCESGDSYACYIAGKNLVADKPKEATKLLDRSCKLTAPVDPQGNETKCQACNDDSTLPECKRRETWHVSTQCLGGNEEMCETLGDRYLSGDGVDKSNKDAAQSFKYACDSSIKSACGKLDDVCHADGSITHDVCAPSLLHTDVFYEAEWQLRTNQKATLSDGTAADTTQDKVTLGGGASAGAGVSLERGHLDADLVVSVVLDRARQAAVKLVVEELKSKMRGHGLRSYMRDLLEQGAKLLADTTSLRRDALQDLGMTLVRAFAASNLVRTVLGDVDALKAAPTIGPLIAGWKDAWIADKDGHIAPDLEAYLADTAYWALGAEPIFQREGASDEPAPACPFKDDRKALCDALASRDAVTKSLHIDGVLTALNMVRALGSAGGMDIRRLIEAIVQSTSIVDFASTPGLNINQWQAHIVDDLRTRFTVLRDRMADLSRLVNPKTYADDSTIDVLTLARQAKAVRTFLATDDAQLLLGASIGGDLAGVLSLDQFASGGLQAPPTPEILAQARKDAGAALDRLGSSWLSRLSKKSKPVFDSIDKVFASLDELDKDVLAIRSALEHHQPMGADVHTHLSIDDLPLGDLDELLAVFPKVVDTLDTLDAGVRDVLPQLDLRGVRFARSSVVRLLGFLDLMSRVARSVRLTQTVKQVIDTLALLGRWKDGEFSAPLYDMLQPVLDVIETRNPMPLEQLFAIVGRVRLDSLVTSLDIDDPCSNEDRAECWVFKIAYSLQEAITREGDSIKIDGAEVAKRLATFGDDFRRREKSRFYFHLTVGMGTISTQGTQFAPLISEQIGFGWATPSFWHDRLTFKVGIAASGILYRMLLDNKESDAVMGNAFVAVDIYDLVELYGAATALVYPPTDMEDAHVEPGVSFGLSVPLSAYLERL